MRLTPKAEHFRSSAITIAQSRCFRGRNRHAICTRFCTLATCHLHLGCIGLHQSWSQSVSSSSMPIRFINPIISMTTIHPRASDKVYAGLLIVRLNSPSRGRQISRLLFAIYFCPTFASYPVVPVCDHATPSECIFKSSMHFQCATTWQMKLSIS
jgi:hypothetical protein